MAKQKLTLGQKAADFATAKIGSWGFLIGFNTLMLTWIIINLYVGQGAFDPFPFILLNLCLSWLAGVQAPLIMISQNRQEEVQRQTVENINSLAIATYDIATATKDLLIIHNAQLTEILNEVEDLSDDLAEIKQDQDLDCNV